MSILDRLKEHWLGSLVLLCVAVAAATWKVAWEVHVVPRDFQIVGLKEELQRAKAAAPTPALKTSEQKDSNGSAAFVLSETGIFEGKSATTNDGRVSIKVAAVLGDSASLSITTDTSAPIDFKSRPVGSRVTVDAGDALYFVDIHRVRGNIVDIAVSRHKK